MCVPQVPTPGTMHNRQDSVILPRRELINYYLNSNHSISRSVRPIVYALQNFDRNFANLVAPPTDGNL